MDEVLFDIDLLFAFAGGFRNEEFTELVSRLKIDFENAFIFKKKKDNIKNESNIIDFRTHKKVVKY